ncbi:hypothetical protein TNIN_93651 [Trichonephila inaurata madagascariensis]|uniref:Uncharacterized protein n=1 Tax=Trichonephila inaurata madagascariensis TaxID=2747483 RepID=A0A8X6Y7N2_9ARAC|nr:hypothetical protein TNIN_93651 [Trichonephila inaurata madagascariensis]
MSWGRADAVGRQGLARAPVHPGGETAACPRHNPPKAIQITARRTARGPGPKRKGPGIPGKVRENPERWKMRRPGRAPGRFKARAEQQEPGFGGAGKFADGRAGSRGAPPPPRPGSDSIRPGCRGARPKPGAPAPLPRNQNPRPPAAPPASDRPTSQSDSTAPSMPGGAAAVARAIGRGQQQGGTGDDRDQPTRKDEQGARVMSAKAHAVATACHCAIFPAVAAPRPGGEKKGAAPRRPPGPPGQKGRPGAPTRVGFPFWRTGRVARCSQAAGAARAARSIATVDAAYGHGKGAGRGPRRGFWQKGRGPSSGVQLGQPDRPGVVDLFPYTPGPGGPGLRKNRRARSAPACPAAAAGRCQPALRPLGPPAAIRPRSRGRPPARAPCPWGAGGPAFSGFSRSSQARAGMGQGARRGRMAGRRKNREKGRVWAERGRGGGPKTADVAPGPSRGLRACRGGPCI